MHNSFSRTSPENSGGAENLTEKSGPDGKIFFCYMYEYSLRHQVWVPEINVRACNSALTFSLVDLPPPPPLPCGNKYRARIFKPVTVREHRNRFPAKRGGTTTLLSTGPPG